jgi:hypothetical protein
VNPEQIETFAIRAARGDDVKKWPARFSADQKKYWREFVVELAKLIGEAEFARGYAKCQEDHAEFEQARQSRSLRRMLGKK